MSDILDLSLAELADAIYMRKISSKEAAGASIDAFARHGERLNAVVGIDADRALEQAAILDDELTSGRRRGRLHGVPMAHKDMFYRSGRPSVCGTTLRRDFVPDVTATALARLDDAGAIDMGRLNMVEFALGITGHNRHTGHPRNPWNTAHITGGSSSGPVASVAARLVPASLGSDTGGSIRVPACCTGLVGLKPTYGRISRFGAMPLSQSLDHVGVFTRTARDTAILLGILAGHDPRDPLSAHHRVPDYEHGLEHGLEGLRVGYVAASDEVDMADEVVALLEESRAALADLGAELVEIHLPDIAPLNTMRRCLMFSEATAHHLDFLEDMRDGYTAETLARMEPGLGIDAASYLRARSWRSVALRRFMAETFAGFDVLHLPAVPQPIPRIADTDTGGDPRFVKLSNEFGYFIFPFNYLGLPAISVPIGHTGDGLPMAMQVVGRPFAEARLLQVAHQFDRATGFSNRKPPL
ncbi:MAG: amidase [Geminicoccaceae bacterium]